MPCGAARTKKPKKLNKQTNKMPWTRILSWRKLETWGRWAWSCAMISCLCFMLIVGFLPCESESHSVVSNSCDPMDYTVHGILQARILNPFSRGSSQLRDGTQVPCIAGGFFTSWATGEALYHSHHLLMAARLHAVLGDSCVLSPWASMPPWEGREWYSQLLNHSRSWAMMIKSRFGHCDKAVSEV